MNWASDSEYHAPSGMVAVKPGDVMEFGGHKFLAVMVNDCRARMEPLERVKCQVETRFGDKAEFDAPGRSCNVSVHVERGDVLERRGKQGVKDFLAGKKSRKGGGQQTTNENEGKETETMAAKTRALKGEAKKRPARGGLAAEKAADEAGVAAPEKRERKPKAAKVEEDINGKETEVSAEQVVCHYSQADRTAW